MKISKKIILKIGIGSLVVSSAATTAVVATKKKNKDNFNAFLDGKHFTSEASLATYAKSTLDNRVSMNDEQLWSLDDSKGTRFFDSPIEATDFIDQNNIEEQQAYVHEGVLHGMGELNRIPDNFGITNDDSVLHDVYRGRSDSIFLDENDAHKSLVQAHNVLELDSMYFSHDADLDSYLMEKYGASNTGVQENSFALKSANGVYSNNINSFDNQSFDDFVEKNAELNLVLPDGTYKTTEDFKNEMYEDWAIDYFDANANYVQVEATQGKGLYLIDNVQGTKGSVIGNYLLESAMSPSNMATDGMKSWTKSKLPTEALTNSSTTNIQFISSLSSVSILSRDVLTYSDLINSAQDADDIPDTIHNVFTGEIESRNNDIENIDSKLYGHTLIDGTDFYESFLQTELSLLESKRTTFLQMVPILRSWAIDKIVVSGLPFELVTYINEAMDYVLRVIDFELKKILDPMLSDDAKKFNISQIYNFLNTPQYQMHPDIYFTNMIEGSIQVPPIYKSIVGGTSMRLDEISELVFAAQVYTTTEYSVDPYIEHVNLIKLYNNNVLGGQSSLKEYPVFPKSLDSINENAGSSQGEDDWYLSMFVALKKNAQSLLSAVDFIDRVDNYLFSRSSLWEKATEIFSHDKEILEAGRDFFEQLITQDNVIGLLALPVMWQISLYTDREVYRGLIEVMNSTVNLYDKVKNFPTDKIQDCLAATKSLGTIGKTMAVLGVVGAAVSVALVAVDIIVGLVGQKVSDVYVYNHNHEVNYYWDGGEHRLRSLFGFTWETNKIGTEKFDLIPPIQILTAQTSDSFYLDSANNSPEEMKIHWINNVERDIAKNGIPENSNWRWKIALVNKDGIETDFESESTEELKQGIVNHSLIENYKINFYYTRDGLVDDLLAATRDKIDSIIRNIKPSWVIQFPEYIDGKYVVMPYKIPATKSKPLYGLDLGELDHDLNYQYMILNYNFDDESFGSSDLPNENAKDVTEYAIDYFFGKKGRDVDSKTVMLSDINSALNFNALPSKYELVNIYKTRMKNGEEAYFTNRSAAQNWVAGNLMFDVEEIENNEIIWTYGEYDFRSITDFVKWVIDGNGDNND